MRRRPHVLPAAFAVVLLVVGQLAALAHGASTRHVECTEHGEQLEAAQVDTDSHHECEHAHWVSVEGDEGSEHDDCLIQRTLRQDSLHEQLAAFIHVAVITHAAIEPSATVSFASRRPLYRIAPKTSPPRA